MPSPYVPTLLRALPLSFYLKVFQRKLTALFYHTVSEEVLPHVRHLFSPFSTDEFEDHLHFLKNCYRIVDYAELVHHCATGTRLPAGALHLSFDDGYSECYSVVRPLLLKHGIPCVFFVTSDWVDNRRMFYRNKVSLLIEKLAEMEREGRREEGVSLLRNVGFPDAGGFYSARNLLLRLTKADEQTIDRFCEVLRVDVSRYLNLRRPYLSAEQIRQMASEGFVIGAHSRSHSPLSQLNIQEAEEEIVWSARLIREISDAHEIPFSFPFSSRGFDLNQAHLIRKNNPSLGLFFDSGGLGIEKAFVVRRFWAEKGRKGDSPRSIPLPKILRGEYAQAAGNRLNI